MPGAAHIRYIRRTGAARLPALKRGFTLTYAETETVESGLKFKTISGLMVETTGVSLLVESHDVYVHEVVITEGIGEGNKYLHNLDSAEPLSN